MKHLLACLAILAAFNVHAQDWDANNDVDQDGCVGVGDVLQILSVFGSCEPTSPDWQCADSLEYQNYWYKTVLIGEQCWFAENLRTELYQNGESIPGNLSNAQWIATTEGAQAPFNYSFESLNQFGRLYNGYSVMDNRGLCPTGWNVPTDADWSSLEVQLGMSQVEASSYGWRGTEEGLMLKSFLMDTPSWNGSNSSGFSALPGGWRTNSTGSFNSPNKAYFWTSDGIVDGYLMERSLASSEDRVFRTDANYASGYSIRCLQN